MESFAATGEAPRVDDAEGLEGLAERHVVVLDPAEPGRIVMAHPFAAPGAAVTVRVGDRSWWGNCAWDALGILAALDLPDASVAGAGVDFDVSDGRVVDESLLFHVAVPAARWWDDIAFT
jgi:hypothetical protein